MTQSYWKSEGSFLKDESMIRKNNELKKRRLLNFYGLAERMNLNSDSKLV